MEVVTVADVDAEDHVGNSLLIWELTFAHKAKLLFRLWAQGLVKILKLKFRQDFEAGVWILVEILKLGLVKILNFKFCGDADVWLIFLVDADLCLNLWYDLKKLLWQDELNPRVRFAFGNI